MSEEKPKIAVIGGGTGSFMLLSALKKHTPNITAVVNMADDGGSTGMLRDEFGVLPPGDVRQCLVALSRSSQELRELFSYRFNEGSLSGHSFGNLLLTALEKTKGNFGDAVKAAERILQIVGRVIPITLDDIQLVYTNTGGEETRGEFKIAYQEFPKGHKPSLRLDPPAQLNPEAKQALLEADLIVIAPGNLYGSLAPALLVQGVGQVIKDSQAKVLYVSNLVTQPGQSDGFSVADFAAEIERFCGQEDVLDYVVYNTAEPSPELKAKYEQEQNEPVSFSDADFDDAHYRAIGMPLMAKKAIKLDPNDQTEVPRSFIRHDGTALARAILEIL